MEKVSAFFNELLRAHAEGDNLDGFDIEAMLIKHGILEGRPATEADLAESNPFDMEPGDTLYFRSAWFKQLFPMQHSPQDPTP